MDPITQGLLGAAIGQAVFGRKLGRGAALVGALGGMIGDLDVLQGFFLDPVANIAYHRHWTHSLVFLPVGAAVASLPFLKYKKWKNRRELVYATAVLGYLSHLLIDACTSYGTVLFWPFSSYRVAFDSMPIIDPIFTFVLLVAVIVAAVKKRVEPARVGLAMAGLYVALGFIQHSRALDAQQQLAAMRGHQISEGRVMPTLGNIVAWRSVYRSDRLTHSDAIRVSLFDQPQVKQGQIAPTMTDRQLPIDPVEHPQFARDYELWMWFTDGYATAVFTDGRFGIADTRYSMQTENFSPLWAMTLDESNPGGKADVAHLRSDRQGSIARLWDDIWTGSRFVPLDGLLEREDQKPPSIVRSPIDLDPAVGHPEQGEPAAAAEPAVPASSSSQ